MAHLSTSKYLLIYGAFAFAGFTASAIAASVASYTPPLSTHRLTSPVNSSAATAPAVLQGVSALPTLVFGNNAQRYEVAGGVLLQAGFSQLSIPVLERALANGIDNTMLHVALGEALTRASGGHVSDRAKEEFEFALHADPNDLIARFHMGHWFLQHGKPKRALIKWLGLMRAVGDDQVWYDRLWLAMPLAAEQIGIDRLALQSLCTASM
jgi:predicted Zn-dependent protease